MILNESAATQQGPRILLIEDDTLLREVLSLRLRAEGYQLEAAANGRVALDLLDKQGWQPELIITDLLMPEVDGFTVIERVSGTPSLSHLPIIVISSVSKIGERMPALKGKVALYLEKPVKAAEVLEAVTCTLAARPGGRE